MNRPSPKVLTEGPGDGQIGVTMGDKIGSDKSRPELAVRLLGLPLKLCNKADMAGLSSFKTSVLLRSGTYVRGQHVGRSVWIKCIINVCVHTRSTTHRLHTVCLHAFTCQADPRSDNDGGSDEC